jgi:hypothetical protein
VRRSSVTVRRSSVAVRRSSVVRAPGTAASGSNPARHSSLGAAQESPGAGKKTEQVFPSAATGDYTSAAAGLSARHLGCTLYQYGKAKEKKISNFFGKCTDANTTT